MSSTSPTYRVFGQLPAVHDATLVVMLSGWVDASGAGAAVLESLYSQTDPDVIIEFDPDTFVDYRARRPTMQLRNGLSRRIRWNTPEIRAGKDSEGHDVLFLTGPEPDFNWKLFTTTVGDICTQLGVKKMIGLGAYPFASPHTRPVGLACTTPDPNVLDRMPYAKTNLDAPAGVESVLEHALFERGLEVVGLWAQVPHYVSSMAYPAASAALIEALAHLSGLSVSASVLRSEAIVQRERLDKLVEQNDEHAQMVRDLERAYDAEHPAPQLDPDDGPTDNTPINGHLPTVDELAAEVEQFLRDQQ